MRNDTFSVRPTGYGPDNVTYVELRPLHVRVKGARDNATAKRKDRNTRRLEQNKYTTLYRQELIEWKSRARQ